MRPSPLTVPPAGKRHRLREARGPDRAAVLAASRLRVGSPLVRDSSGIRRRHDPGRTVQAYVPVRCGKRGESALDGIENGGQVLNPHLAHKARNRSDLHRELRGGTRRAAKRERHIEALHTDSIKSRFRQDGAQSFLIRERKRSGCIRIGRRWRDPHCCARSGEGRHRPGVVARCSPADEYAPAARTQRLTQMAGRRWRVG